MGLGKYFRKRHFDKTPEPQGRIKKARSKKLDFVVQEHHASQLHYDFRLEMDGVLKSWAVPKGPSMDPHEHHLAVAVEDHPYEYRKFEGTIPEGNYGAGQVYIWDKGTYEPRIETDDPEKTLLAELKKGHITFVMHGEKLKGEFALIKMHDAKEENAWLLVKKGDAEAETSPAKLPHVANPWPVKPMLCTLVDQPFDGDDWLFEIKWDGYRAIASKHGEQLELYSRNGIDFMAKYPPVAEALQKLEHDVILDGEIVVTDEEGRPHFEWLQHWGKQPKGQLNYYIFDLLWLDGQDMRGLPLAERKEKLRAILPSRTLLHYSDHVSAHGKALFEQARAKGLEGIVAKKASSPYHENERGPAWLKIKTHQRQEVVIGGFTEPRGSRTYLGSLLVGVYDNGELVYTGHSGGGIPDEQRGLLRARLEKLERAASPFQTTPKPNAPVHWVKPELVCEMSFSEWTADGLMRHPQFEGLREDKDPRKVVREMPKHKKDEQAEAKSHIAIRHFEPTHLDKVFFPDTGYTKGDLMTYYESAAEYILPYLKDRPCSLFRQPDGIKGEGFFQKDMPHLPEWAKSADIFSDSNHGDLHWMVASNLESLLYMVQLGCIEINPWNSRVKHLDKPDWIIIDLDPEGVTFEDVIQIARTTHTVCEEWGVTAYPKTSGKSGIHIFIPTGAKYDYEQVKNFANLMAIEIHKREPKLTSIERMPEKRPHRIYLDYLQNRRGQTLAAPYSVRPTPVASVSTPLHWDEVKKGLKPSDFTIKNIGKRLDRIGDIWKPVMGKGVDLTKIIKRLDS